MVFECADCFFKLMTGLGTVSFTINSAIFTVFIYYRRILLKSNDYKLLCSMIVADMFVGIFCILYGVLLYSGEEALIYKLSAIIPMFSTMFASIASIAGITVNRMIAVHRPLRYFSIMTSRRLMMLFITIWLVPLVIYIVQLSIYMTCTSRFELKIRSLMTVGFFLIGSIALGISNCLLYIAIRRQIRLINAHAMLTVQLQRLHYTSNNEESECECDSQYQQTDDHPSSNDSKANNTRTFDNIGFDNGNKDKCSKGVETNKTEAKHTISVTKQDSRNGDTFALNGDKEKAAQVLPCRTKTYTTKERKLANTSNNECFKTGFSQKDSEADSVTSCVPMRGEYGATSKEVPVLASRNLALVCSENGQKIRQTDENVSKSLQGSPGKKVRWNLRADALGNKKIRLAKNVTTAVGRLHVDRKKRHKARRDNLHMAHMCILVVMAFIICWLPLSIYRLRFVLGMEAIVWYRRFALFLAAGNSLVNPFIYLLKQNKLRRYIKMAILGRRSLNRKDI